MSLSSVDCDGGAPTGPCKSDQTHLSETAFNCAFSLLPKSSQLLMCATDKNQPVDAQAVPYVVMNDDSTSLSIVWGD